MLKPNNGYPDRIAIDVEANTSMRVSYQVNGSEVLYNDTFFVDADTGNQVLQSFGRYEGVYNGEILDTYIGTGGFSDGHNYIWYKRVFGSAHNVKATSGNIVNSSGTSIAIAKEYGSKISAPISYDFGTGPTEIGSCYLEVVTSTGKERKKIVNVGTEVFNVSSIDCIVLTIESAFSESITGKHFIVYQNFIKSDEYFFMARQEPAVTVSAVYNTDDNTIDCSATYSQADGTEIKSYQFELYKGTDKIDESLILYTGRLTYSFIGIVDNTDYTIKCIVTTQDDVEKTVEKTVTLTQYEDVTITNHYPIATQKPNYVRLTFNQGSYAGGNVKRNMVFRKDVASGDIVPLSTSGNFVNDYLYTANKTYQYLIVPILQNDKMGNPTIEEFTPAVDGWVLQAIKPDTSIPYNLSKLNKDVYVADNVYWNFRINADDGGINQNRKPSVNSNGDFLPYVIEESSGFLSGSLSCEIGQVTLDTGIISIKNDISLVLQWREYVKQNKLFLLRTYMGEIMVIKISSDDTTKYVDEDTSISFSYTQVLNTDDIIVR